METMQCPPHIEARAFNREQRLYDDTTTWLAEVLPGSMRTPFEYRFDGRELYATDGSALKPIFDEATETARTFGPERAFELRRRLIEAEEYDAMIGMAQNILPNTMVVVSDFPPELMEAADDVDGYNVSRKQTMLRIITRREDGTVLMRSQSLDMSDRTGLTAIYASLGFKPQEGELLGQRMHVELPSEDQDLLVDQLMGVYDRSLSEKYGGQYYAGRKNEQIGNTYDFVRQQSDLINAFITDCNYELDKKSLYNLAAAVQGRFEKPANRMSMPGQLGRIADIRQEMVEAGRKAADLGTVFSGCGASLGADGDKELSAEEEMAKLGLGNKSEEDKYGSLTFKCQKGHPNTRPRNRLIEKCKTCGISVKC